ncbi:MAG: hypothetical protein ACTSQE_06990 [Candidatus Heimdallarchaeaceae archaeon]
MTIAKIITVAVGITLVMIAIITGEYDLHWAVGMFLVGGYIYSSKD